MEKRSYKTIQRSRVLGCLREHASQAVSVEAIQAILNSRGESVGQTTIYRTLNQLEKDGIICRHYPVNGKGACFQYAGSAGEGLGAYRLLCTGCGHAIQLRCESLDSLCAHMKEEHEFNLDRGKTVLYGLCGNCAV